MFFLIKTQKTPQVEREVAAMMVSRDITKLSFTLTNCSKLNQSFVLAASHEIEMRENDDENDTQAPRSKNKFQLQSDKSIKASKQNDLTNTVSFNYNFVFRKLMNLLMITLQSAQNKPLPAMLPAM